MERKRIIDELLEINSDKSLEILKILNEKKGWVGKVELRKQARCNYGSMGKILKILVEKNIVLTEKRSWKTGFHKKAKISSEKYRINKDNKMIRILFDLKWIFI